MVRAFPSVAAYVDLLATMIELREFVHHAELGRDRVRPGSPVGRRPGGAARSGRRRAAGLAARTPRPSIGELLARAAAGAAPSGVIRARVVAVSGSASGQRIEVTDGTGRLDVWCPGVVVHQRADHRASLRVPRHGAARGPTDRRLGRRTAWHRAGHPQRRPARCRDPATPLYDELFGTPAKAQATAIRPLR